MSSAKLIILEFEILLLISDTIIRNNNGPSTVPCDTPLVTWLSVLNSPGILPN